MKTEKLTICEICHKSFPTELGGRLCPGCEDKLPEAYEMLVEMELARGGTEDDAL